jgi:hypothetical protein
MKGTIKALIAGTAIATLAGCSGMTTIAERDEYAQPDWYAKCAQAGTEGWFWWEQEYAYACGGGESQFVQASEEQMYAIAMNNFAKRINGTVNSRTALDITDSEKKTRTVISYEVTDTKITDHLQEEKATFKYAGKYYTFIKLKMKKEHFDELLNQSRVTMTTAEVQ